MWRVLTLCQCWPSPSTKRDILHYTNYTTLYPCCAVVRISDAAGYISISYIRIFVYDRPRPPTNHIHLCSATVCNATQIAGHSNGRKHIHTYAIFSQGSILFTIEQQRDITPELRWTGFGHANCSIVVPGRAPGERRGWLALAGVRYCTSAHHLGSPCCSGSCQSTLSPQRHRSLHHDFLATSLPASQPVVGRVVGANRSLQALSFVYTEVYHTKRRNIARAPRSAPPTSPLPPPQPP